MHQNIPGDSNGNVDKDTLREILNAHHETFMERFATSNAVVTGIDTYLRLVDNKLDEHIGNEEKQIANIERLLQLTATNVEDRVLSGFPNKDPIKHHDYHIEIINNTKNRQEMIREVIIFALKGTLWVILAFIGAAVWSFIKQQIR